MRITMRTALLLLLILIGGCTILTEQQIGLGVAVPREFAGRWTVTFPAGSDSEYFRQTQQLDVTVAGDVIGLTLGASNNDDARTSAYLRSFKGREYVMVVHRGQPAGFIALRVESRSANDMVLLVLDPELVKEQLETTDGAGTRRLDWRSGQVLLNPRIAEEILTWPAARAYSDRSRIRLKRKQ